MRSLNASQHGIQRAEQLLALHGISKTALAEELAISRSTVSNFFAAKSIDRQLFVQICQRLEVDWQEVAELDHELLAKDYKLLRRLEDTMRLEGDPKRKAKLRLDIESLREQIQERAAQLESVPDQPYQSGQEIDKLLQQVRSHCCEKIQNLYSKIRLLNFQQVDVERLYVETHILERPSSSIYAKIADLLQGCNSRHDFDRFNLGCVGKRRLGLEVAKANSKLMVLGKPGSGKSIFLRYLAVACCKGEFLSEHIPVLIELRSIQDANQFKLLDVVQREFQFTSSQQTQDILRTGKVLLLLDGLDEVPYQSRQSVQNQIVRFTQNYYKIRIVLTCRTQTVEYILPTFEYLEISDFNSEQIYLLAQMWFTALADTPEHGAELATRFVHILRSPGYQQTAELAVTPVLLSLMCWIFQDTGDLPVNRTELYQYGIDLLLQQWDISRGIERTLGGHLYQSLNIEQKQQLLGYVAIRKYEKDQYFLFEQQEIQQYIAGYFKSLGQIISERDSQDILKAIEAQHGLLVERASQIYSFSHLTFQEFFAAKFNSSSAAGD